MLAYWVPEWPNDAMPLLKFHDAMLNTVAKIIEGETEFMLACFSANMRLAECFMSPIQSSSAGLTTCYQDILGEMHEASVTRMNRVASLSEEFRQQLWEEV